MNKTLPPYTTLIKMLHVQTQQMSLQLSFSLHSFVRVVIFSEETVLGNKTPSEVVEISCSDLK